MATVSSGLRQAPRPPQADGQVAQATSQRRNPQWSVDLLRISLGFIFLWPFLDKAFGLGYSTSSAAAWVNGGSPTKGFLSRVEVGPLQGWFRSIAGDWWVNWLFMLALLGVGLALLTGAVLRIAAVAGGLLMLLMWAAEWPMARHTSAGEASGSSNPFLDYHLVFLVGLIVVAVLGAGSRWGLGRWWSDRTVVDEHSILR